MYNLCDPYAATITSFKSGVDLPEMKTLCKAFLKTLWESGETQIFVVSRERPDDVRMWNIHPSAPGVLTLIQATLEGKWRIGTAEEKAAAILKVYQDIEAHNKREIATFAKGAAANAAAALQADSQMQAIMAQEAERDQKKAVQKAKEEHLTNPGKKKAQLPKQTKGGPIDVNALIQTVAKESATPKANLPQIPAAEAMDEDSEALVASLVGEKKK